MRLCLLPYFDKEQFSGDLRLNKTSFENLSELEESVGKLLEGDLPFRTKTDIEDTQYEESINELIQVLYSKIDELNLLFDFDASSKRELNRFVKGLLLPKPLTRTEYVIQANIAGSDLITEDERRNIRFNNLVRSIYGKGTSPLNASRQELFNGDMLLRTIIDTSKKKLVTNELELNMGIVSYQLDQYNILRNYLEQLGYDLSAYGIPQSVYHTDTTTKVPTLTKGYSNILTLMYNVIEKARREGVLEQQLEDGWTKFILNNLDTTLYRALNAYINLAYFDDVLQQFLGEYILINRDYDAPINVIKNELGELELKFKYTLARGNVFATKTWGVEEHDALKEMAKFSLVLINSIPVYEYNVERTSESEAFGHMLVKDFVNTISKLLDMSSSITDLEISDAICQFQLHPRKSILTILQKVFGKNNKTILDNLFKLGFDLNYINYLYSIYRTCFKGNDSWDSIELKYIRNNRVPSTYPLIDTIFGIMNSNVSNNFLQTVYNYDEERVETNVKKKYNDRSTKFDIIDNVNSLTIDRDNKLSILDTYPLLRNGRNYSITISIKGNPAKFDFISTNNTGILDKGSTSPKLNISNMVSVSDMNLDSINQRRKLVGGVGLSDDEVKFMSILRFIDTMLSTNFSSDQEGLRKLSLMYNIDRTSFRELFASAARALVVTDIYNLMENALKEDGTHYSKLELLDFLRDKNPYSDAIYAFNSRQQKPYFINRFDGTQLSTLYSALKWLDALSQVNAILSGETSKSVISNLDGDKIPNFSPEFLGARLEQLLFLSHQLKDATANLLFVLHRNAVKSKVINTDVLTLDGVRKQIKNMTSGELIYDSIVNKFFTPYLQEKVIYSQPTTYSDKTKFLLYGVSLDSLGIKSLIGPNFDLSIERLMQDTIGKMYLGVWNNVSNDYKKLFPEYVINDKLDTDSVLDWMNSHSARDLLDRINEYNIRNNTNLVFYKDTHYREIELNGKKRLSINELLIEYAFNLYGNKLHSRLLHEKLQFLLDLLSNRITFPILRNPDKPLELIPKSSADSTTRFLIEILGLKALDWVHGSSMILAKAKNRKTGKTRDILYGEVLKDEEVELNPVLNAYFMLDNLIGNNLRMSLTGSEINHKVKALAELNLDITGTGLYKLLIKTLNPKYSGNQTTFYDILKALHNYDLLLEVQQIYEELNQPNIDENVAVALNYRLDDLQSQLSIPINTLIDPSLVKAFRTIYDREIYKIENAAQNAQFKRNVIIPGTMRPYTPNCINGIGRSIKIAVINDVEARVFNFDGKSKGIDAHDGSAMESPITSILENKSLQDSEVGTIKKPIHHWYDDRYGTATLLKYAVDTITNLWMRLSEGNDLNETRHGILLRKLFKKMHNIRWHSAEAWAQGKRGIDLIDGCDYKLRLDEEGFHSIDFFEDILEGHQLFYKKGDLDVLIIDFGRENGIYYTLELNVDPYGNRDGDVVKVYHYFNENGDHFPSTQLLVDTDLHTIDSLFELHTALGGIYSESKNSLGELQYSEASNTAVANFVNAVAYKKTPDQSLTVSIDLENYYQPLKSMLIDIVANNSAVKNGAGNLNQSTAYYDDSKLSYMEIGTSQYGIQMDADHTADEGKMTEFSLVISSLDAGGRLHDYVSLIYEALGEVAIQLSLIELDAVDAFRSGEGKSKLYDIIGRTIINNLAKSKGEAGLAEAIIANIKKGFNMNTDHELDPIKIPFSDPNIYSRLLPTFVSIINTKSIKKLYPGQGTVMVPGYDLSMIYDLDGKTYLFEDLIKLATASGYTSTYSDLSAYNRDIVKRFLNDKLASLPSYTSQDIFQPTENVLIWYDVDGITLAYHASLNDIEDYYLFKDNISEYLSNKGIVNAENIRFQKDITIPRNLAPAKISWTISLIDPSSLLETLHPMNIFDHWRIKGLFLRINEINNTKGISNTEKKRRISEARKLFNPQQAFDELDKGLYIDLNGNVYAISNLENKSAELIMSNLYKTKFGIRDGDSLSDVGDKGYNYFVKTASLIPSTSYDIAFTKQTGKHLYLTFKPMQENSDSFDSHLKSWPNTIPRKFEYPEGTPEEDKKIINRIYATTKDNLELFEVGREILTDTVIWNPDKKKFTDRDGRVIRNLAKYRRYGEDKVLEYIEFLSQYNVLEEVGGKVSKYVAYNINRGALSRVMYERSYDLRELTRTDKEGKEYTITDTLKFNEEINDFISRSLLARIYLSSDFNGIQLNSLVTPESHTILKKCLYRFGNALRYDPELSNYLSVDLLNQVEKGKPGKDGLISYKLNSVTTRYRASIAKKQYASFLKSLNFTASRIPAQTLQSFMLMHCVGFTGTTNNQCFVSHWLTWLQGSDY